MRWSDKIAFYQHLESKGSLREEDRKPQAQDVMWLIEAFHELGTERSIGMSLGPIPHLAIHRYRELYKHPCWFTHVIHRLDAAYRSWLDEDGKDGERDKNS